MVLRQAEELMYQAKLTEGRKVRGNGEGYPQGLKGEEIPLMSRIISILDAFDVMTHRQQNKPAMTTEEALLELHLKAGSQLDTFFWFSALFR